MYEPCNTLARSRESLSTAAEDSWLFSSTKSIDSCASQCITRDYEGLLLTTMTEFRVYVILYQTLFLFLASATTCIPYVRCFLVEPNRSSPIMNSDYLLSIIYVASMMNILQKMSSESKLDCERDQPTGKCKPANNQVLTSLVDRFESRMLSKSSM
ncbi:hypothetical protein BDZ97DRAFT_235686 [Flammula alnicola]|nr:hypothetical protein BDZ97DRAFT_235686 [Flammula alnicola]